MRRIVLLSVCAASIAFGSSPTPAGAEPELGLRANLSDDADFGVGAEVRWPFLPPHPRVAAGISFDYFFPGTDGVETFGFDADVKYWEINANITYDLGSGTVVPYAGAGLNYARGNVRVDAFEDDGVDPIQASESDVGANLVGGVRYQRFFAEAKVEAGGGEMFVLTVGLRF